MRYSLPALVSALCLHKLAVMLNAMVRDDAEWRFQET